MLGDCSSLPSFLPHSFLSLLPPPHVTFLSNLYIFILGLPELYCGAIDILGQAIVCCREVCPGMIGCLAGSSVSVHYIPVASIARLDNQTCLDIVKCPNGMGAKLSQVENHSLGLCVTFFTKKQNKVGLMAKNQGK